MIVVDRLPLGAGLALLVVRDGDVAELRPVPWLVDENRRAKPSDRAAEALTALFADGSRAVGRFRLTVWGGGSRRG